MKSVLEILRISPVIPVIAIDAAEHAVPLARALVAGGLRVLEITLRTAHGLDAIRAIAEAVPEAVVGVGTLLEPGIGSILHEIPPQDVSWIPDHVLVDMHEQTPNLTQKSSPPVCFSWNEDAPVLSFDRSQRPCRDQKPIILHAIKAEVLKGLAPHQLAQHILDAAAHRVIAARAHVKHD